MRCPRLRRRRRGLGGGKGLCEVISACLPVCIELSACLRSAVCLPSFSVVSAFLPGFTSTPCVFVFHCDSDDSTLTGQSMSVSSHPMLCFRSDDSTLTDSHIPSHAVFCVFVFFSTDQQSIPCCVVCLCGFQHSLTTVHPTLCCVSLWFSTLTNNSPSHAVLCVFV